MSLLLAECSSKNCPQIARNSVSEGLDFKMFPEKQGPGRLAPSALDLVNITHGNLAAPPPHQISCRRLCFFRTCSPKNSSFHVKQKILIFFKIVHKSISKNWTKGRTHGNTISLVIVLFLKQEMADMAFLRSE